ncbi:MAG: RNA polymerase sigma factor RpoD/SigA [Gemmatimonadota bacterium]|nr:RNA polymerase sigma factor RpoD/SigA [Gemmatimonadota bacterium]
MTSNGRSGKKAGMRAAPVDDDALGLYFREIRDHPILTRAEEARLARGIREGDPKALETLVRCNLRFVVTVARKYRNLGLSLADLIAEGNMGLLRAAERFDETRGVRFVSYAVWWIRQAILQALAEQSSCMRLPVHRAALAGRITRGRARLAQSLGRPPRAEEVAEAMGLALSEIETLTRAAGDAVRLDEPRFDDEEKTLLDVLPDDETPGPEEIAEESVLNEEVRHSLGRLDPREASIVRLYYGLDDEEPLTLSEIGAIYDLSRERVRQIKARALDRLRHAGRKLEPFAHA